MTTDPTDDGPDAPTGSDAVREVATSTSPSPQATANATAFFMGDEPPPGKADRIPMLVNFGSPAKPRWANCVFRTLGHEEFVAAANAGLVDDENAPGGKRLDPFRNWSHVAARAILEPDLGPILRARIERKDEDEEGPITDTAQLLRGVFRYSEGTLRAIMDKVDERSHMGTEADKLVLEIEAGKDSP